MVVFFCKLAIHFPCIVAKQDFLTAKASLERCTREGNLLLAKTRYAGSVAGGGVGAAQLPDAGAAECAPFSANVRVRPQECGGAHGIRFRYLSPVEGEEEEDEERKVEGFFTD